MVTDTGERGARRATDARESRLDTVALCALGFAVLSVVSLVVPALRGVSWLAAAPAVVFSFVVLGMGVRRKSVTMAALMIGWFTFSYSIAMLLWG